MVCGVSGDSEGSLTGFEALTEGVVLGYCTMLRYGLRIYCYVAVDVQYSKNETD